MRVAGVLALVLSLAPLGLGSASASQGGDDHKVTLCHRTNSENNPYVVITIDKAGVFKTGHDGHDEGPVWQPGFKASGQRWGDIIPPFTYYESPQAERDGQLSEYPGLNWAEGQATYENGCQPTTPPSPEQEQPFGELAGRCVEGQNASAFRASGTFDDGDAEDVMWRLELSSGAPVELTASPYDVVVDAAAGTKVMLQSSTDGGATWKNEDGPVTVTECPPKDQGPTTGGFTVECDADGAVVTVGSLDGPEGTTWLLRVDGVEEPVTSGQVVHVAAKSELALVSVKGGTKTTRQRARAPEACPEGTTGGTVSKTADPATGTTVPPGSTIAYTVTVKNTGTMELTDEPVVDTLPIHVTAVPGSVSDSGVISADGRSITWTVTLAPSASKTLTYRGLVAADAPAGASLVNEVTFLGQRSTTTHTVGSTGLEAAKSVSPTGAARFGDTLTYTLTAKALGNLPQSGVTVSDTIPTGSTYVAASAVCVDAGTCSPTVSGGIVTWALGSMDPGATRTVRFQVTIDTPAAGSDGSIPAVQIVNVGTVRSGQVGPTPSNEVRTPVAAVQGVKVGQPASGGGGSDSDDGADTVVQGTKSGSSGGVLASTGSSLPLSTMLALTGLLLLMGSALVRIGTKGQRH